MSRKGAPTRRQGDARRAQAAHGDNVRGWLQRQASKFEEARKRAADKRARDAQEEAKADLDEHAGAPHITLEWLHRHTRPSRTQWRVGGKNRYHGIKNTPYVNPARDAKSAKSGRLRKELRP